MVNNDKRFIAEQFRQRLLHRVQQEGISQAELGRRIGLDRSAINQLINFKKARLPRAETVASMAQALNTTTDWLLGLSSIETSGVQILHENKEYELLETYHNPNDAIAPEEQLIEWKRDSANEKIRYLPTSIPDVMKTETVERFELQHKADDNQTHFSKDLLEGSPYYSQPVDFEICLPYQRLLTLKDQSGIWANLSEHDALEQLDKISELSQTLYPRTRLYLVDELNNVAAPYTLFGHKRVAVYMGAGYFVFTTRQHIEKMHHHFDNLIREAIIQPPDVHNYIQSIIHK